MVCVQFYSLCPTSLACGLVAADDRSGPFALLVGAIGMSALPVRVILASRVAPFDAALMGAKPLLPKGSDRLVVLDAVWLATVFANLGADTALPERAICTRPMLGSPLSPAFVRAKPIGLCPSGNYRFLFVTPFTVDDDGHEPIILQVWPSS